MPQLNPYETRVVAELEAWLATRPSLPGVAIKAITSPFAKITRRLVPRSTLLKTLHKTEEVAAGSARIEAVLQDACVASLQELKAKPLEFCDRLAAFYSVHAERAAMIDGVVAGLGGTATELLNLPILIGAALRTIMMVGHSYGYALEGEFSQNYLLLILDLSTIDDPARRQKFMRLLRLMENHHHGAGNCHEHALPVDEITESMTEDVELSLIEQLTLESIPVAGDAISMMLDYDFMHHVDLTARQVFRERRLREEGKITTLKANPVSRRRSALREAWEASGQMAYMFGYGLSYFAALPAFYAISRLNRGENACVRGATQARLDACRDARALPAILCQRLSDRAQLEHSRGFDAAQAELLAAIHS